MRQQNKASEFCLSPEEVERLIDAARTARDRALIACLYYAGLRRAEARALDAGDVDLPGGRLLVRRGKGEKARVVPLHPELSRLLGEVLSGRREGPVFAGEDGRRISLSTINYVVAQAGRRAGLVNPNPRRRAINPHLLRHSFARHFLARGGDPRHLAQILGHASIKTTLDVYGTPSEEEVRAAYHEIMLSLIHI